MVSFLHTQIIIIHNGDFDVFVRFCFDFCFSLFVLEIATSLLHGATVVLCVYLAPLAMADV